MGREAVAVADWRGQTAEVKVLLESNEIILRGAIRARIPRTEIAEITTDGDLLRLVAGGEPLTIGLGADQAEKWAAVLRKPPRSLADKLGISADQPAYVVGPLEDEALRGAIEGARTDRRADAAIVVAVVEDRDDLEAAVAVAGAASPLALWCVYPKGAAGSIDGAVVRTELRARGYVDTKSSAVSDRLTATRYSPRRVAS